MNKILISTVIAFGLLLLDSPEAAAHEETYSQYGSHNIDKSVRKSASRDRYHDEYRRDHRRDNRNATPSRAKKMPRWLKKDRSFRRWYEHTQLQRIRTLSWNQLFDIYRWEYSYFRSRRH